MAIRALVHGFTCPDERPPTLLAMSDSYDSAVGARTRDVIGLVLGGGLALWGSKWMEGLMFRQSPRDPLVFGVVTLVLLVVALLASSGPALAAARVDPNVALRND